MDEAQKEFESKADLAFEKMNEYYTSKINTNYGLEGFSDNLGVYTDFIKEMPEVIVELANNVYEEIDIEKDVIEQIVAAKMREYLVKMKEILGV